MRWTLIAAVLVVTPALAGCINTYNFQSSCVEEHGRAGYTSATDTRVTSQGPAKRVERDHRIEFPAPDRLTVLLDGANGPASVAAHEADTVVLVVTTTASAPTASEAEDALDAVLVVVQGAGNNLIGCAGTQAGGFRGRGNFHLGTRLTLLVPASTVVTGVLDTSNGPISLTDVTLDDFVADTSNARVTLTEVRATDLVVDTSNARVTGDVVASGRLTVDTSNGSLDIAVTPNGALDLRLDTSNGSATVTIPERPDIGYHVAADTSNGRITSDLADAELHGDDSDAVLMTRGGDDRPVLVTGLVDTSNGNVHFRAA